MPESNKECPYCKKAVDPKAIKCPYCQEWLNKKELSWKNPFVKIAVWILFILIIMTIPRIFLSKKLESIYQSPESYSKSSKVTILGHKLSKNKKAFSILGEVENKEKFKWDSLTVLVTFKDKKGEFSSLGTGYIHNLEPNSKKPFEVSFGCSEESHDPERHNSYTIEIEDGRGEFIKPKSTFWF